MRRIGNWKTCFREDWRIGTTGTLCHNGISETWLSSCSVWLSGVGGTSAIEAFVSEGYNYEKPCRER